MKKLLLLILFSIATTFSVRGQDEIIKAITDNNYNFKLIDNNVSWQYVYKTNKSAKEIRQYFERSRIFNIVSSDSVSIYGKVDKQAIDYKKYGFSTGMVPMYIIGAPCSYNINVSIKEGRYQVTIFNTVFNPVVGMGMFAGNMQVTLNKTAYNYNRDKFKSMFFSQNAAAVLATAFYDTYLIKDSIKESENW